jgi:hypothetical protein
MSYFLAQMEEVKNFFRSVFWFFSCDQGSSGNLKTETVKNTETGLALKIRINSNKERQNIRRSNITIFYCLLLSNLKFLLI